MADYRPLGIDIEQISLMNHQKYRILDISRICSEFNIYEDLFSFTMKGDCILIDTIGLIENFPIVGDEYMILKFRTINSKDYVERVFRVYSVSNRQMDEERSHIYSLHFCSPEFLFNLQRTVTNAFIGSTSSRIVKDVFEDYIKRKDEYISPKKLNIQKTINPVTIIPAQHKPFEIIQMCCREGIGVDKSQFIFYENSDNFHFRSVQSLKDESAVWNFFYADPSVEISNEDRKFFNSQDPRNVIISIDFAHQFDTIRNVVNGFYDNRVFSLDLISKQFTSKNYQYNTEHRPGLGGNKITSLVSDFNFNSGDSHERMIITNLFSNNWNSKEYLKDHLGPSNPDYGIMTPRIRQTFLNTSINEMQGFNQIKVRIAVPGNSTIRVGDCINIFVPQNSGLKNQSDTYNLFFGPQDSPKFMTTAVTHNYKYTTDQYVTILECIKDDLGKVATDQFNRDAFIGLEF